MSTGRFDELQIRGFDADDRQAVIGIWRQCGLIVPWNNPDADIERKLADSAHLFFVGTMQNQPVATCMAGYDGHRGWIYYLAVDPVHRRKGFASRMVAHVESALMSMGCPKIDLMVRNGNREVISFYQSLDYRTDPVVVLSKRLLEDQKHDHG